MFINDQTKGGAVTRVGKRTTLSEKCFTAPSFPFFGQDMSSKRGRGEREEEEAKEQEALQVECKFPVRETIANLQELKNAWSTMFAGPKRKTHETPHELVLTDLYGSSFGTCMHYLREHASLFIQGSYVSSEDNSQVCDSKENLLLVINMIDQWIFHNVTIHFQKPNLMSLVSSATQTRYYLQECLWLRTNHPQWLRICHATLTNLKELISDFQEETSVIGWKCDVKQHGKLSTWAALQESMCYIGVACCELADENDDPHGDNLAAVAITSCWINMQLHMLRSRSVITPTFSQKSRERITEFCAEYMSFSLPEEFHGEFLKLVYRHETTGGILETYLRIHPKESRNGVDVVTVINELWSREKIKPIQDACEPKHLEDIFKNDKHELHELMLLKVFTDLLNTKYRNVKWLEENYIDNFCFFEKWHDMHRQNKFSDRARRPLLVNVASRWCVLHSSTHLFYCNSLLDAILTWFALVRLCFASMSASGLRYDMFDKLFATDQEAETLVRVAQLPIVRRKVGG